MTTTPEDAVDTRVVAMVTGAASGIGASVAKAGATAGYDLVLVDRDAERTEEIAIACRALGSTVIVRAIDVTNLGSLIDAAAAASQQLGSLSAVLHCAGIEAQGTVLDSDPATWTKCLEVNVIGTLNVARATMSQLIETRGSFTAVASDAGVTGAQGFTAYTASKHAVVGVIRSLALDYGPQGVRSNAVAPGFVQTAMADQIFDGDPSGKSFYESSVPLGRFAAPEEVAAAMLHLAGSAASYTNGLVYNIDGGSTAGYFTPEKE